MSSRSLMDDSSNRSNNSSSRGHHDLPSLDLHGHTKEAAIRRLTDFLEVHASSSVSDSSFSSLNSKSSKKTSSSWVCVITGSGSHSSQGPVLRTEVQRLLERRQIEFTKHNAGCFVVNARTGITFYAPEQPRDTKVVVKDKQQQQHQQPADDATGRMVQEFMRNTKAGRVTMMAAAPETDEPASCHNSSQQSLHMSNRSPALGDAAAGQFPSLQQVVRDEQDLAQAQRESLAAMATRSKQESQEYSALQAAMALSKEQIEKERQIEEAAVLQALDESKRLAEQQMKDELELMTRALDESKRDSELDRKQESIMMKKAMEESKMQVELERQQEKECLEEAIEESKRHAELEAEQLRLILEESRQLAERQAEQYQTSDEVLLSRAMEESKRLARAEEEEALLIQRAMEASVLVRQPACPDEQALLLHALTQSERLAQEMQQSEEELIRQVMAQSLKER